MDLKKRHLNRFYNKSSGKRIKYIWDMAKGDIILKIAQIKK